MRKISLCLIFILALSSLVYLRMLPVIGNEVDLKLDRAYHYRLTKEIVVTGSLSEVDYLSTHPEGRKTRQFLPVGMYYICAYFHKFINQFIDKGLLWSIFLFCSVMGSLIFIPLYFIAYEIYRKKYIAFVSALLGALLPGYLYRTFAFWYRYEVAAIGILFLGLLFFIKTVGSANRQKAFWYAALSTVSTIGGLYIWRGAIFFLIAYTVVLLYLLLRYRKISFNWCMLAGSLIVVIIFSRFMPHFAGKSHFLNVSAYLKAVIELIFYRFGFIEEMSEYTRLLYYNKELIGVNLKNISDHALFSISAIFAVFFIFRYFQNIRQENPRRDILFIFLVFFLLFNLLFLRIRIITAPLVALTIGESLKFIFDSKKKIERYLLLGMVMVVLVQTALASKQTVINSYTYLKMTPELKQMTEIINEQTSENAVILSHWPDGYVIQAYCNRPTITDGLIESRRIVDRIMELSKIYCLPGKTEKDLLKFCVKYGVTHILVPFNKTPVYAGYANLSHPEDDLYFKSLPNREQMLIYKFIYYPASFEHFRYLFDNQKYMLLEVIPSE